jgi:hypothetical protein
MHHASALMQHYVVSQQDEGVTSLARSVPQHAVNRQSAGAAAALLQQQQQQHRMLSEVQHHDAMFSAPGTVLPEYSATTAASAPAPAAVDTRTAQQQQQQQHSRAVRQQRSASPDTAATTATTEPLYKVVKMGDTVEARYTADDVWYEAKVSSCDSVSYYRYCSISSDSAVRPEVSASRQTNIAAV